MLAVIGTAAALFGDRKLEAWLSEVYQTRYSATQWCGNRWGYSSPFNICNCSDIYEIIQLYLSLFPQDMLELLSPEASVDVEEDIE